METTLVAAPTQAFVHELTAEARLTRRVLERVPAEQFGWQPHAKSMTLGQLARHTADLVGYIKDTLDTTDLDLSVFDDAPVTLGGTAELLAYFDERAAAARSNSCTAASNRSADNSAVPSAPDCQGVGTCSTTSSAPAASTTRSLMPVLPRSRPASSGAVVDTGVAPLVQGDDIRVSKNHDTRVVMGLS